MTEQNYSITRLRQACPPGGMPRAGARGGIARGDRGRTQMATAPTPCCLEKFFCEDRRNLLAENMYI